MPKSQKRLDAERAKCSAFSPRLLSSQDEAIKRIAAREYRQVLVSVPHKALPDDLKRTVAGRYLYVTDAADARETRTPFAADPRSNGDPNWLRDFVRACAKEGLTPEDLTVRV
jgi:hypothetical protein